MLKPKITVPVLCNRISKKCINERIIMNNINLTGEKFCKAIIRPSRDMNYYIY